MIFLVFVCVCIVVLVLLHLMVIVMLTQVNSFRFSCVFVFVYFPLNWEQWCVVFFYNDEEENVRKISFSLLCMFINACMFFVMSNVVFGVFLNEFTLLFFFYLIFSRLNQLRILSHINSGTKKKTIITNK